MKSGIYLLKFKDLYYIGSTKNFDKRFKRHLKSLNNNRHHNIILQRAFNKYKEYSIEFSILENLEYTKDLIIEKEQYYIEKFKSNYKNKCCNLSDASFGDTKTNHPRRKEIIEKTKNTIQRNISEMTAEERKKKFGQVGSKNGMFGKTHSEEVKQKSREKVYTEDSRNKMSISAKIKFQERPDLRENLSKRAMQRTGIKNPFYGKEHSEETKKKIAEKNKGKIPGNVIRISINNKEYSSYHEASCDLDIPHTTIRWRCLSENKKFKDYKILS